MKSGQGSRPRGSERRGRRIWRSENVGMSLGEKPIGTQAKEARSRWHRKRRGWLLTISSEEKPANSVGETGDGSEVIKGAYGDGAERRK